MEKGSNVHAMRAALAAHAMGAVVAHGRWAQTVRVQPNHAPKTVLTHNNKWGANLNSVPRLKC